jgi:hypothetical protein
MLCENPKTNVAAKNNWKSRGKFNNLFLVRVIIGLTLFCHSRLGYCFCVSPAGGGNGGRFVVTGIQFHPLQAIRIAVPTISTSVTT